jgi:cyclopropane fatty-acyl-phospholipid synthase-like methyltransferase
MINLQEYRSDRSLQNCTGGDLEWGRSSLFDNFTEQWCKEHSDTVYASEGYFPPTDRKTAEKIAFIKYLNLKARDKCKILDIGTGAGQFMKLCMSLGHDVSGTEVQKRLDDPVYKIHQHYNLNLFELKLMPSKYEFLPESYDLITLLRTQFNDIRTREFKEEDWYNWKDNMFDHLKPGGQLFLKTNLKFQKKVIGGMQTEIMKAFGKPIKGFNSFTYHFTKP